MQTIATTEEFIQVAKRYQVVIDRNVYLSHSFLKDLEKPIVIDSPESHKNFQGLEKLLNDLLEKKLARNDELLCIGGGALSDLVGLSASLYKRGITYSIAPTSILSLIDASIGGKTAINTKIGKNLVGSFHFPKEIYHFYDFLKTLPKTELDSGHGELIKYAFLSSKVASALLNNDLALAYKESALYKNEIVALDPYEKNERKLLNLGHTIGHALEKEYKLSHGIAVCLGLELIIKMYAGNLLEDFKKIKQILLKEELISFDVNKLFSYIEQDKKIIKDEIDIIIPKAIGESEIKRVKLEDFKERFIRCI